MCLVFTAVCLSGSAEGLFPLPSKLATCHVPELGLEGSHCLKYFNVSSFILCCSIQKYVYNCSQRLILLFQNYILYL